jgi:hypothetical protein
MKRIFQSSANRVSVTKAHNENSCNWTTLEFIRGSPDLYAEPWLFLHALAEVQHQPS